MSIIAIIDPPYGINVVGKNGNIGGGTKAAPATIFKKVIGDENTDVAEKAFKLLDELNVDSIVVWGGNYFTHFLPVGGRWFVWDKNRPEGLTLSDCELAWSNIKGVKIQKFKCTWDGYHKEGESGTRVHPNQKPIKLISDLIEAVSDEGDIILDLFLGSGSTLIACEQLDRTCYMMEIDPKYCDVIIKRYNNYVSREGVG